MSPDAIGGIEVARITISRILVGDDFVDQVTAVDATGEGLVLAESLSMLTLAEHTLVDDSRRED